LKSDRPADRPREVANGLAWQANQRGSFSAARQTDRPYGRLAKGFTQIGVKMGNLLCGGLGRGHRRQQPSPQAGGKARVSMPEQPNLHLSSDTHDPDAGQVDSVTAGSRHHPEHKPNRTSPTAGGPDNVIIALTLSGAPGHASDHVHTLRGLSHLSTFRDDRIQRKRELSTSNGTAPGRTQRRQPSQKRQKACPPAMFLVILLS
jgi:hypothetical protein